MTRPLWLRLLTGSAGEDDRAPLPRKRNRAVGRERLSSAASSWEHPHKCLSTTLRVSSGASATSVRRTMRHVSDVATGTRTACSHSCVHGDLTLTARVSLYVCVCTHVYMRLCLCVYMHVYGCTNAPLCRHMCRCCACMYISVYIYADLHVYVYISLYICAFMYAPISMCVHACACLFVCICACVRAPVAVFRRTVVSARLCSEPEEACRCYDITVYAVRHAHCAGVCSRSSCPGSAGASRGEAGWIS